MALLASFTVFRPFWLSRLDRVLSDPVDGRFTIAILEHWYHVFSARSFSSPKFFFPQPDVLGFSDTDFLLAIPYAVQRWLGVDRYLAFEFTMMFFTILGFFWMLQFLRVLEFRPWVALVGAVLFVTSNIYYLQIVHAQLVSVVFVPLLLTLAYKYWRHRSSQTLGCAYIAGLGVLLGLLFFTSFYIAWFAVVGSASVALYYLFLDATLERSAEPIRAATVSVWKQRFHVLLLIVVFSVAMVPFFIVYVPALHETGSRTLTATLYYMPSALGIFDVGSQNLLWGRVSTAIEYVIAPQGLHEHPSGLPYLTLAVFTATLFFCAISRRTTSSSRNRADDKRSRAVLSVALTWLVWSLACVKIRNQAIIWALVRSVIPGAAAIRVPSRFNLVLEIAAIIVCMFGWELLLREPLGRLTPRYILGLLLPVLLCVEQFNTQPTHLISRTAEARKFSKIQAPPKGCSAFFVSDWSMTKPGLRSLQTDAMLVAEDFQIPTLNGYSGWFPAGWHLLDEGKEQIAGNAREWAFQHGLSQGLCSLEISSGTWSSADLQRP